MNAIMGIGLFLAYTYGYIRLYGYFDDKYQNGSEPIIVALWVFGYFFFLSAIGQHIDKLF